PVRFGVATSLRLAKVMHLIALHCWIAVKFIEDLNWIFSAGVMASGLLLIWEHRLIKKDDLSKLNMAFFNMNAVISVTLFVALFIDLLVFK
ncbi:MAG: 4-hydroxybenzoate octaprenyltransferase, partial [Proteobacteria bacterium]|nr:4-hydroxybenzoate octaprenyltransferase [Pseudomonadota bacterium]